MITEALRHCPGIGPVRLARLHAAGLRCWEDVLANVECIPEPLREQLFAECQRCLVAQEAGDVRYFVEHFAPQDKWRILSHFFEQTTYFDIETQGLEFDAPITVIACWHRGTLQTFAEHENLDAFLELLDDVTLLASFNGSSFDVPRILDTFHIPELPCPHVDLRWMSHHQGWKGGLKDITEKLGITRPPDLCQADGELAIWLWNRWIEKSDTAARNQLLRYCGSDVILLLMLAHRLVGFDQIAIDYLWSLLPPAPGHGITQQSREILPVQFGSRGSLARLRAIRTRFAG